MSASNHTSLPVGSVKNRRSSKANVVPAYTAPASVNASSSAASSLLKRGSADFASSRLIAAAGRLNPTSDSTTAENANPLPDRQAELAAVLRRSTAMAPAPPRSLVTIALALLLGAHAIATPLLLRYALHTPREETIVGQLDLLGRREQRDDSWRPMRAARTFAAQHPGSDLYEE